MLLRNKKNSNRKETDPIYIELLRLARVSDIGEYDDLERSNALDVLNQVPYYSKVHWRIIPLLYAKAIRLGVFDKLNHEAQVLLRVETKKGIAKELAREKQLMDVAKALSEKGISIILLKGSAFANELYTRDAPRLSNDIDILIKSDDWDVAVSVLKTLMDYKPNPFSGAFADGYEISFVPKNMLGASLDLHSSLIHSGIFDIDERSLWESSVIHTYYAKDNIRVLSPEHAINHQVLHSFKDMNFCKYSFVDCYELLSRYDIDSQKLYAVSRSWQSHYAFATFFEYLSNVDNNMFGKFKSKCSGISVVRKFCCKMTTYIGNGDSVSSYKTTTFRFQQLLFIFAFSSSLKRSINFLFIYIKQLLKKNIK